MAGERDEPRRDEVIDESRSQYIVTEHSEGIVPADAPPPGGHRDAPEARGGDDQEGADRERQDQDGGDSGGSVSVMNLAITATLALVFGLLGAWAYSAFLGGDSASEDAQASGEGNGREGEASPGGGQADQNEMMADASADRSETLPAGEQPGAYGPGDVGGEEETTRQQSGRIDQLAEQLTQLREELQARPDPASGSQMEQIAKRLDEVTERLNAIEQDAQDVQAVARRLQQRSDRLDEMSDLLDQVESRLTTISDRVDAAVQGIGTGGGGGMFGGGLEGEIGLDPGPAMTPRPPGIGGDQPSGPTADAGSGTDMSTTLRRVLRPTPSDDGSTENSLEKGVEEFRSDRFASAQDTFLELLEERPGDARIWYFAALARGKATGEWKGETERLVLQGVELERDGMPPKIAIDAAFEDLTERQGAEWLRFYRRRAAD